MEVEDFSIPIAFGTAFIIAIVYIECINYRLRRRLTQIRLTQIRPTQCQVVV